MFSEEVSTSSEKQAAGGCHRCFLRESVATAADFVRSSLCKHNAKSGLIVFCAKAKRQRQMRQGEFD